MMVLQFLDFRRNIDPRFLTDIQKQYLNKIFDFMNSIDL